MSRQAQKVELREEREPGHFWADNEIIDEYGPKIGAHGIAVYMALCRFTLGSSSKTTIGLTKLAEQLKMGRATLLSTVDKLKEVGLIDVAPGDRVNATTYSILKVKKGGSNENQVGGSDQNQCGSNENQVGGSDQNCKKTTIEKTTSKRGVEDNVTPLDSVTRESLAALKGIEQWKKSDKDTLSLLAQLRSEFSGVDALAQCKDLAFNASYGERTIKNFTSTLRSYFRQAAKGSSGTRSIRAATDSSDTEKSSSSPECVIEALKHYDRDGIRDLRRFAPLARQWDFTTDEEIPWEILRQISPDQGERDLLIQRLRSFSRRTLRQAG